MSLFAVILASQLAVEPPLRFPPLGTYGEYVSFCYDPPDTPPFKPIGETCFSRTCILERSEGMVQPTVRKMECSYKIIEKEYHEQLKMERAKYVNPFF